MFAALLLLGMFIPTMVFESLSMFLPVYCSASLGEGSMMKRNRLPNSEKRNVFRGLVSVLTQCGLTSADAVRIIEAGNPSMHARVCRWIAADPLYRRCGLCLESFRRALGLWIAYKADTSVFVSLSSTDECFADMEGSDDGDC